MIIYQVIENIGYYENYAKNVIGTFSNIENAIKCKKENEKYFLQKSKQYQLCSSCNNNKFRLLKNCYKSSKDNIYFKDNEIYNCSNEIYICELNVLNYDIIEYVVEDIL